MLNLSCLTIANRLTLSVAVALLSSPPSSIVALAQAVTPSPTAKPVNSESKTESPMSLDSWHSKMLTTPLPQKGCFESSFPSSSWKEVPCGSAPPYPQGGMKRGPHPFNVGSNTNYFAVAQGGIISSATGSFDSVIGVLNEYGLKGGTGSIAYPNTYTLQLNTNELVNIAPCQGHPQCFGWEQFIFENSNANSSLYIQYWLYNYGTGCPDPSWTHFPGATNPPTLSGCYKNSASPMTLPVTSAGALNQWSLTGSVNSNGDAVQLSTAGHTYAIPGDNLVDLAHGGWKQGEFNIFGDANGSVAFFNIDPNSPPASLTVRLNLDNGTANAPTCNSASSDIYTVEQNNLVLGSCKPFGGASPAIVFTESGSGQLPPGITVGDPHLTTFYGLHYDFQASGEFILLRADTDFLIQTRQKPFARQPAVSVNTAVATKMGDSSIAVCLPKQIEVNGKSVDLQDGAELGLSGGVLVSRRGNVYLISRASGEMVRAELNQVDGLIDISVYLGKTNRENVRGLLGAAPAHIYELSKPDGTPLKSPVTLAELRDYADSWRVQPDQSLLCANDKVPPGFPAGPLYAEDLSPNERARVRTICVAAGVKEGALLDDCMLVDPI